MRGVVLWDFDGTLAGRLRAGFGQCLWDALAVLDPTHGLERQTLSQSLRSDSPWDSPEIGHPELSEPDVWWAALEDVLLTALMDGCGLAEPLARSATSSVRSQYTDLATWTVFLDVRPALRKLTAAGWRHLIVSNHVPELPAIAAGLGVAELVDDVVCSALVGYEKPRPEIFHAALEIAGTVDGVWMVGDSPTADYDGAEAVGIPAILVRNQAHRPRTAAGLIDAANIILAAQVTR